MTFNLYKGPAIACTFCCYALSWSVETRNHCMTSRPRARYVIDTPGGHREVCQKHAQQGRPDARRRRVSRVAP